MDKWHVERVISTHGDLQEDNNYLTQTPTPFFLVCEQIMPHCLKCPHCISKHQRPGHQRVIKRKRKQMTPYSWGINHPCLKVTTVKLVQCQLESPLYTSLVAGSHLISHLLAPVSQSVTLPATWNLQLLLGLLKKARQPKWRRCSQWRLTCPVACCKIRRGVEVDIMLLASSSNTGNCGLLSLPSQSPNLIRAKCQSKLSQWMSRVRAVENCKNISPFKVQIYSHLWMCCMQNNGAIKSLAAWLQL